MLFIPMSNCFIRHSGENEKKKKKKIISKRVFFCFYLNRELKRVAHHPVVFVLTDNSSLSAAHNPHLLFPLSIVDELKIEQIQ